MHRALRHHAAETEALPFLHFAGRDLRRVEEEHHVLLERRQRESGGDADASKDAEHPVEPSFACRSHVEFPTDEPTCDGTSADEPESLTARRRRAESRARFNA